MSSSTVQGRVWDGVIPLESVRIAFCVGVFVSVYVFNIGFKTRFWATSYCICHLYITLGRIIYASLAIGWHLPNYPSPIGHYITLALASYITWISIIAMPIKAVHAVTWQDSEFDILFLIPVISKQLKFSCVRIIPYLIFIAFIIISSLAKVNIQRYSEACTVTALVCLGLIISKYMLSIWEASQRLFSMTCKRTPQSTRNKLLLGTSVASLPFMAVFLGYRFTERKNYLHFVDNEPFIVHVCVVMIPEVFIVTSMLVSFVIARRMTDQVLLFMNTVQSNLRIELVSLLGPITALKVLEAFPAIVNVARSETGNRDIDVIRYQNHRIYIRRPEHQPLLGWYCGLLHLNRSCGELQRFFTQHVNRIVPPPEPIHLQICAAKAILIALWEVQVKLRVKTQERITEDDGTDGANAVVIVGGGGGGEAAELGAIIAALDMVQATILVGGIMPTITDYEAVKDEMDRLAQAETKLRQDYMALSARIALNRQSSNKDVEMVIIGNRIP